MTQKEYRAIKKKLPKMTEKEKIEMCINCKETYCIDCIGTNYVPTEVSGRKTHKWTDAERKMLIDGEMSDEEISKRIGIEISCVKAYRGRLKKRGAVD